MINDSLNSILTQIAELNPILAYNYKVVDPNIEQEPIGINDALGNHMFIRQEPNAGDNINFSDTPDSGCGGYRYTFIAELYIILEACYMADKVFNILSRQIGTFDDVVINSGSYDASAIYTALTGEQLPRQMTIVKYRLTVTGWMTTELCEENICDQTCC